MSSTPFTLGIRESHLGISLSHRASPDLLSEVFSRSAAQALAEPGFIVIAMDVRGSHRRSRAFRDESYGGLSQPGHLEDHVAVIRELARRHPSIDLERVGIYGTSGGGYATVNAGSRPCGRERLSAGASGQRARASSQRIALQRLSLMSSQRMSSGI